MKFEIIYGILNVPLKNIFNFFFCMKHVVSNIYVR